MAATTPSLLSSSKVRAVAWDPTGTAALSICPVPTTTQQNQQKPAAPSSGATEDELLLDVFLSHDGTGCNAEETECLLRQLDARDEWIEEQQSQRGNHKSSSKIIALKKLSMDYRAAMCECLMQLQAKQQHRLTLSKPFLFKDNLIFLFLFPPFCIS